MNQAEQRPEPYAEYLSPTYLGKQLRRRSVRGGAAMLFAQGTTFALNVGSTAVLARLLVPADFGLLAMVATLTRFIEQLKDLGLAAATIQRRDISHAEVSYLFWVNVAVGIAASLLTVAAAPVLAWPRTRAARP